MIFVHCKENVADGIEKGLIDKTEGHDKAKKNERGEKDRVERVGLGLNSPTLSYENVWGRGCVSRFPLLV